MINNLVNEIYDPGGQLQHNEYPNKITPLMMIFHQTYYILFNVTC